MALFFKTRTVASILSTFASTLKELEDHQNESLRLRDERLAAAEVAKAEAATADSEANAAARVASKIRELVA